MNIKNEKQGFTLIELLIVVLIIAILAAIAVPNFLEFQTRAKISRVQSDMRTSQVALEAYYVDNDTYPPGRGHLQTLGTPFSGMTQIEISYQAWKWVTTPIAYITTAMDDPFIIPTPNVSLDRYQPYWYTDLNFPGTSATSKKALELGHRYYVTSPGPAGTLGAPYLGNVLAKTAYPLTVYDPTNGTVSRGRIFVTNKGWYHSLEYKVD